MDLSGVGADDRRGAAGVLRPPAFVLGRLAYGMHLPWLLREVAACVLAGVCIGALWGLGVRLRIRLAGWEIAQETARMAETCNPEPLLLVCRELQALWLDELRPKLMMAVQLGMAEAAGRLGRLEEARPHLEFVAARGNKLAIRTEAEDRLAALTAD